MLASAWSVAVPAIALVLGIAAATKLRSPASVDRSFRDLNVPAVFSATWMRRLFPWAELALAVALLVTWGPLAVVVAILALLLCVAYLVLVIRALAAPEPVSCGCFGESSEQPVDRRTLARNIVLVAVAAIAVLALLEDGSVREQSWVLGAWAHLDALVGGVIAAAVVGALALNGDLAPAPVAAPARAATAAVPAATTAPSASGAVADDSAESDNDELDYERSLIPHHTVQLADGSLTSLRRIASESAAVIVWAAPGCGGCMMAMSRADEFRARVAPLRFEVITWSGSSDADSLERGFGRDTGDGMPEVFSVQTRPWAILLGADGMLAGGPVLGVDAIDEFITDIRAELDAAGIVPETNLWEIARDEALAKEGISTDGSGNTERVD